MTQELTTQLSDRHKTFSVANNGDAGNAVDDITPTAFEEANGSGSGTYTVDFGSGMDGSDITRKRRYSGNRYFSEILILPKT